MLTVNKTQLLNTELSNYIQVDAKGRPCIKCAFLKAAGSTNLEIDYANEIGMYDGRCVPDFQYSYRVNYPKLAALLDKYEKRLFEIKYEGGFVRQIDSPTKEKPAIEKSNLVKDFVAELEELGLVNFTENMSEKVDNQPLDSSLQLV